MRLVYFGTAAFAVPALEALAKQVVLVVSQPDRPSGRGLDLRSSPVKAAALALGLKVETPEKSRSLEFVERLRACEADALFVAAYGQLLSQAVLESARRGGINLHGSILPKYRGAAPIQRAILAGDAETGISLMQMARGMDTGDVIAMGRTSIGPDETAGELTLRLARMAADLAYEWAPRIVAGDYPRIPQDESMATHAPKVDKTEAELSPWRRAEEEYRRFRAFTPAPGAYLRTAFGLVKVGKARLGTEGAAPGVVISTAPSCQVAFETGSLHLLEVQPEGKKRMCGRDFANGLRLRAGDSLF